MKSSLYVPIYAITLLLSAALLFAVQPMFSKMVLPLLGGTPQVWNTAMLFFQLLLLAGYAYAHGTTKFFSVRVQAVLHLILLVVFAFALPIAIPAHWSPPTDTDPTFWQLSLMAVTIGGPFFVLSASAPMLQRWFAGTDHKDADNPYFLYGASNLGSMTALIAYPVLIEPVLDLSQQSQGWMYGYIALMVMVLFCVALAWLAAPKAQAKKKSAVKAEVITWTRRGKWLLLAMIPSSLMLGVTTYVTTDVASVPLLWIIPLALYVGTFIIVFARKPLMSEKTITMIFGGLLIALFVQMMTISSRDLLLIPFHMVLFFFAVLTCHSALSNSKPSAQHLTEFYLVMSLGGALGGVFNALIAPNIFVMPLEYALALGAAACMRFANEERKKINLVYVGAAVVAIICAFISFNIEARFIKYTLAFVMLLSMALTLDRRWVFGLCGAAILIFYPPGHIWGQFLFKNLIHQERNFFGVIKVVDTVDNERVLLHGTTNHGTQALAEEYRYTPLSYYSRTSPIADLFSILDERRAEQNVAVLGLGVGVTACFNKDGRHFDFFEIDPDIIKIAQNPEYFTFLSGCGSPYKIIPGDARLTLAEKPDEYYDFILADAYSSDNIPVHLITHEALVLYISKLKPGGVLGFNISNNYLDIEPILAEAAKEMGLKGYARLSGGGKLEGSDVKYYPAHVFAFAFDNEQENFLLQKGWSAAHARDGVKLWTDRFSNIVSVIGNVTGKNRMIERIEKERVEKKKERDSGD